MCSSAKAEARLTARLTGRADAKAGLSDPMVVSGNARAQRIKVTLGITGLSPPRVHIDVLERKYVPRVGLFAH